VIPNESHSKKGKTVSILKTKTTFDLESFITHSKYPWLNVMNCLIFLPLSGQIHLNLSQGKACVKS
jgi:hypothetical protein